MTEFKDVNVGDKVRATKGEEEHVFVADAAGPLLVGGKYVADLYAHDGWSVEVLEPAPKPLPTEPGWYVQGDDREVLFWHGAGLWSTDESGEWADVHVDDIPRDLVRLVPESAVEEARAEVITEIVEWARTWTVPMPFVASEIERKFLGGKS